MGNNIKILLLQDSNQPTDSLKEGLKAAGISHNPLVVSTKEAFIEALKSFSPVAILADAAVEIFPVTEALAQSQDLCPDIPFILLTDLLSEEVAIHMVKEGATDYVYKDRLGRLPLVLEAAFTKRGSYKQNNDKQAYSGQSINEIEERYRALFENSADGILLSQTDGTILAANPAACQIFQMTEEELQKAGRAGIVDSSDPRLTDQLKERKEKGRAKGVITLIRKDGTRFPGEITSAVFRNADGREIISTIIRDNTERETYLKKLEDKRAKLQAAQHIAKLGYWELQLADYSLHWTDEVYTIWGRDKETYQPSLASLFESTHPDDLDNFQKAQADTLEGKKDLDMEHRILLPDGSIKWVRERGKLVKDAKGTPILFEGTVQDITEHKTAMEQLAISEARHRSIVQSQTNYVIRTDLQGRYTYCNEKFLKDFGWIYPDGDIIGNDSMLSVMEYHHQRVVETARKCLEHPDKMFQVEIDKPKPKGKVKTTLWDFACIKDKAGTITEVQCMGLDISDRVKAERSLRESNTRYELVTKATSDAIWDWDLLTDNLYWAEGYHTLFGYKPGYVPHDGGSWTDRLHPEDRERVTKGLDAFLESTEAKWEIEYRFRKADGTYANVIDRGFVIRDENNRPVRMVGAMQDLTEKARLEELLNKATKMARIGSYEYDVDTNSLYWSEMTRMIHEVEEDFIPLVEAALDFYKPGLNREMLNYAFEGAVTKGIPFDLVAQIVTEKGNLRWVRVIAEPEFLEGRCTRIYGSVQDIDERKKAEIGALKAYQEKDQILESIGDAFFAVDSNWTVTYWNDRAEEVMGMRRKDILHKNLWEVYADVVGTPFETYYRKAVAENTVQHFEAYYDTLEVWFDVSAFPSSSGLSVFFRDVTDRKLNEIHLRDLNTTLQAYTEELVSSNKGLEQFSYIVSHNLRAPVANILGLGELLKQEVYPVETKRAFLSGLLENVGRLDDVIRDLNQILQVKKEFSEKKEPVRLSELVKDIHKSIQDLFEQEQVQLLTNFEVEEFNTIRSYLQSILYNLISNSIKYRQPGVPPVIEIGSQMTDNGLVITYRDNGLGIDLAKKGDHVFGLYKRFHNHVEGKGMGLFMVKSQIEALGGKISIKSEVNKGTEFTLEFKP